MPADRRTIPLVDLTVNPVVLPRTLDEKLAKEYAEDMRTQKFPPIVVF